MIYPERENIDRWFFDYYERNLSTEQVEALETFLEDHPDLIEDFEAWRESFYHEDPVLSTSFDRTEKLIKKDSHYKISYALYGLALLLSLSLFIRKKNASSYLFSSEDNISVLTTKNSSPDLKKSLDTKKPIALSDQFTKDKKEDNFIQSSQAKFSESNYSLNNNVRVPLQRVEEKYNRSTSLTTTLSQNSQKNYLQNPSKTQDFEIDLNSSIDGVEKTLIENDLQNETRTFDLPSLNYKKAVLSNEADRSVIDNEFDLAKFESERLKIGAIKVGSLTKSLRKISTGLTYIPDICYALPEMNQADILLSNIGAISQTRYQQSTIARWMESEAQQKISNHLTIDGYARSARMGFGLQLNHQYFGNGAISQFDGALIVSPKIALNRTISLEPAARFKFGTYRIDQFRIAEYNNQFIEYQTGEVQLVNYDTTLSIGRQLLFRDLDASLSLNSNRGYIGIQAENITGHFNDIFSNQENDYQHAALKISGIAGTQFLSQNFKLAFSPYVYSQWKSGNFQTFAGFSATIYGLKIGGSLSQGQQTAQLGYQSKRIGILAQTTIQKQITQMRYTHQLTLRINSETSKKTRRYITL